MDKLMMLSGLTGLDFSTVGDIAKTAAVGAGVAGLMYPFSEVAYKLSDNLVKNTIPGKYRKPLPNGYKPSIVKLDQPKVITKAPEGTQWEDHVKMMDALKEGDALRGYTRTLDPKYSNDVYQYLLDRGINPAPENGDYYISSLKDTKLNFSESDFDNKKKSDVGAALKRLGLGTLAGSLGYLMLHEPQEDDTIPKNIAKSLIPGAATGLTALGAYEIKKSIKSKKGDSSAQDPEEVKSENKKKFMRNALIGAGLITTGAVLGNQVPKYLNKDLYIKSATSNNKKARDAYTTVLSNKSLPILTKRTPEFKEDLKNAKSFIKSYEGL